ncbi:hypothetical protein RFI_24166 [Reticulomyxa filosa]|uniref:Uncharacterized protein n=1 Tax=Reticulomyxa filosa TaxID=46433 RepID=X6MH36_RETFI|nr:hypothetical protein RFI_24166 [Reticulomyxa filosa]|eukprot:ETO13209.1 hypothetical protein RFI_24166 [Reticulomyxa filosa]
MSALELIHRKPNDIIMICDEVQCGFGRCGAPYMWAFQHNSGLECVPDIVTLGKPMGNGFPLGAVVTSAEVMKRFQVNNHYMEFFSTFGGNPVACAAGLAVLHVIETEQLLTHTSKVGTYLIQKLLDLQKTWNKSPHRVCYIGDVRGQGLFIGVELVTSLTSLEPATLVTKSLIDQLTLKPYYILLSKEGQFNNVLKIKPPLCFTSQNADYLVTSIHKVLSNINLQKNNNKVIPNASPPAKL